MAQKLMYCYYQGDRCEAYPDATPHPRQPDAQEPEACGRASGERDQLRTAAVADTSGREPRREDRQGEEAERECLRCFCLQNRNFNNHFDVSVAL